MVIPKELLSKWKDLKSSGDVAKIAASIDVSLQSIYNALNSGECSDALFQAMAEYFKAKENLIKQYI